MTSDRHRLQKQTVVRVQEVENLKKSAATSSRLEIFDVLPEKLKTGFRLFKNDQKREQEGQRWP